MFGLWIMRWVFFKGSVVGCGKERMGGNLRDEGNWGVWQSWC